MLSTTVPNIGLQMTFSPERRRCDCFGGPRKSVMGIFAGRRKVSLMKSPLRPHVSSLTGRDRHQDIWKTQSHRSTHDKHSFHYVGKVPELTKSGCVTHVVSHPKNNHPFSTWFWLNCDSLGMPKQIGAWGMSHDVKPSSIAGAA